jgi:hypothetical protein
MSDCRSVNTEQKSISVKTSTVHLRGAVGDTGGGIIAVDRL